MSNCYVRVNGGIWYLLFLLPWRGGVEGVVFRGTALLFDGGVEAEGLRVATGVTEIEVIDN